jgi:hypothetical protein
MNCFPLDINELQSKASFDNNKQFSYKIETSNQKPQLDGTRGF